MTDSAAAIMQGSGAMKADLRLRSAAARSRIDATIGETERLIVMLAAGGFLLGGVWRCCWAREFPGR